jgi:hypothetical protein
MKEAIATPESLFAVKLADRSAPLAHFSGLQLLKPLRFSLPEQSFLLRMGCYAAVGTHWQRA